MPLPIYTIGHSTHTWPDFVKILDANEIDCLIDVRSHPGSRRHPQFNRAWMQQKLGNRYLFMGDTLGGPRDGVYSDPKVWPKHHIGRKRSDIKTVDQSRPVWTNQGLLDYSRWMPSDTFKTGLAQLKDAAQGRRVAICCCELLWWKCHRSMVSDAWEALGGEVYHCWPTKAPQRHVLGNRLERYEKETRAMWRKNGRLTKSLGLT